MTTAGSTGDLVFDPELLGAAQQTLAGHPEAQAQQIIDGLQVDAAAYGTVPGASAAASRVAGWVAQTRAELGRVGHEVTDLATRTGEAQALATQVDGDTQAAARLGSAPR